jgi:hypothetical protein
MLNVPIDVMLRWPTPNWQNPTTRPDLQLYLASSIFLILSIVCVLGRLYSRIFVRRYFGLDDAFILLSFVSCFPHATCAC